MSIRKVSDLEGLDFKGTDADGNLILSDDVMNSLFEVSFPDHTGGYHAYKSMYTRYSEIKNDIVGYILSNESDEINFYNNVHFHDHCYFYDGIDISGDFFLNWEVSDDELTTQTKIKNLDNYIVAINNNYLSAGNENVIEAPLTEIKTFNKSLVQFNSTGSTFKSDVVIESPNSLFVNGPASFTGVLTCTGDAYFTKTINGTCIRALWADLAEMYEADAEYEPGTLVRFGGDKEVTAASGEDANAVVTSKPGFLLNANSVGAPHRVGIALVGRTPVRVVGSLKKFDKIVLSELAGIARAADLPKDGELKVLGIALADKDDASIGLVECAVQLAM